MFNVKLAATPVVEPAIGYCMEGTIKLPRFRSLIASDMAGDIVVTGCRGGWTVGVFLGPIDPVRLATAAGAIRVFTTLDSAVHQLIRLGVTRFEVVADDYENGTLHAPRPDRAAALGQQAEYDAWLSARVAGVRKRVADGTEKMLSPDESKEAVRKLREDLLKGRLGR